MTLLATLPVVSDTPFAELYKMDDRGISTVNRGRNNTLVGETIFAGAIKSLVDFFGDPWTDSQLAGTAEIMYSECHWFCLPELKHFTRRAKAMKFGRMYGRFTPAVLMEWASEYSAQAWLEREPYFRTKASKTNWQQPEHPVSAEKIAELCKSLAAALTAEKEAQRREDALRRQKTIEDYQAMLGRQLELKDNGSMMCC